MGMLKDRLKEFIRYNFVGPVKRHAAEVVYQNMFNNQCLNANLVNDFYPVGFAANYSLMYLVFRILDENPIDTVIELGSGQTTLLIDRMKKPTTRHVCYEDDPVWYGALKPKLRQTDYRYRELTDVSSDGRASKWYRDVEATDFDLLLVDGPNGFENQSRLGGCELIAKNKKEDFIVVFDDADRRGERAAIARAQQILEEKKISFKLSYVQGSKVQGVLSSGRLMHAAYY